MLSKQEIAEQKALGEKVWADLINFRDTQVEASSDKSLDPELRDTFKYYAALTTAFMAAADKDPDIFAVFLGFFLFRNRQTH